MTAFQIIIIFISGYLIFKSVYKLIKKEIGWALFALWLSVWLFVLVINFFPLSITWLANSVGIGRGVDLIVYLALLIVFYVIFKTHLRIKCLEKKISRLVSAQALKKANEKKVE